MIDMLAMAHAHLMASGTLPSGFSHSPGSVSGAVTGISNAIKTVTDAAPVAAGTAGASVAGYHAVAKAATTDPQQIQHHHQGIKNGVIGGLIGIGATSIITILAHIL